MRRSTLLLAGALVCGFHGIARAQTATELNTEVLKMNSWESTQAQSKVVGKISGDFSGFLGSDSSAVITGLRNGTPITLTRTTTTMPAATPGAIPMPTTTTTVINPPTGKMGYGNVYTSLALAKQQLGAADITEPTPEQLQSVLTGGTVTTGTGPTATTTNMEGILTMRSQNMGWGQISQKLGYKLGPVISGMKSANQKLSGTSPATTSTAASNSSSQSQIASGSGKPHGNSSAATAGGKSSRGTGPGMVSASGASSGGKAGAGIVTASGRSTGGQSHSYGRGIVSGSGHVSSGVAVSRGGNGAAHGKGHDK